MPSRHTLWGADTPVTHGAGVVAIGAIDAQRCGHVHHQPVAVLCLFDGAAVFTRQCLGSLHANVEVAIDQVSA